MLKLSVITPQYPTITNNNPSPLIETFQKYNVTYDIQVVIQFWSFQLHYAYPADVESKGQLDKPNEGKITKNIF